MGLKSEEDSFWQRNNFTSLIQSQKQIGTYLRNSFAPEQLGKLDKDDDDNN